MVRKVLVVSAAGPAAEPLLKLEVLTADMPHPGWMRFEMAAGAPGWEEPTVCWYRVPDEVGSVELQAEVTDDDVRRRAAGVDVIDAVGRDLVDAIRDVLGSAGLYRGRPGLVWGELRRRLERDHGEVRVERLDDVLKLLVDAGVIAQDPDVRSSAGPRYQLLG